MKRCLGCMRNFSDELDVCPYCGYITNSQAESEICLKPGTVLKKRYLVGKMIGSGGFGVTYIAWDNNKNTKVAIKEYLPSDLASRAYGNTQVSIFTGQKSEQFRYGIEKYLDEAMILGRFSNFPGIVSVRDYFEENKTAYLVMDFIEGVTLKEYLKKNNIISSKEVLNFMLPLMKSLVAVHNENIIHRDISPENIMINDGKATLIDFGAARESNAKDEKSISIILKQGYAPEEQYRLKGIQGPWTDIYALCATMYRCITGIVPENSLDRLQGDTIKKPSELGFVIDSNFESVLMKGLSPKAEDRYQRLDLMIKDLENEKTYSIFSKIPIENKSFEEANYGNEIPEDDIEESFGDCEYPQNDENDIMDNYPDPGFNKNNLETILPPIGVPDIIYENPKKTNKSKLFIIIGIAVFVVALLVGLCIFIANSNKNRIEAEENYSTRDNYSYDGYDDTFADEYTEEITEETTVEVTTALNEDKKENTKKEEIKKNIDKIKKQESDKSNEYSEKTTNTSKEKVKPSAKLKLGKNNTAKGATLIIPGEYRQLNEYCFDCVEVDFWDACHMYRIYFDLDQSSAFVEYYEDFGNGDEWSLGDEEDLVNTYSIEHCCSYTIHDDYAEIDLDFKNEFDIDAFENDITVNSAFITKDGRYVNPDYYFYLDDNVYVLNE